MASDYIPPKVWTWDPAAGGPFAHINRPISGATSEVERPVGKHPIQLYSLGSPNGQKVTILLEELLAAGHGEAEYDAWLVDIRKGDQFGSGFVSVNPNSKIPAMVDQAGPQHVTVFESGAILLYLADKFDAFLPKDVTKRAETLSWLFWQVGSAPFLAGGFGHFYMYAPEKVQYAIDRYTMEAKRQLDLLDKRLADQRFIIGDDYTIADMAIWPWFGQLIRNEIYEAAEFLDTRSYVHLERWTNQIGDRDAVKRGCLVNRPEDGLPERHDSQDFAALNP